MTTQAVEQPTGTNTQTTNGVIVTTAEETKTTNPTNTTTTTTTAPASASQPDQQSTSTNQNVTQETKTPGQPEAKPGEAATNKEATTGFEKFEKEYTDNGGKLSDNSYSELAKSGFDRKTVDDFISFRKSQVASYETAVYDAAGGKESYAAITKWAASNLKPDEIAAFNSTVTDAKNPAAARFAVEALKGRFERAVGRQPNLQGGSVSNSNDGAYATFADLQSDVNNPLYNSDPGFRAKVNRKLAASNF